MLEHNPPLGTKAPLCRCCGEFESWSKDGLCIRCREDMCWLWEMGRSR